MIKNKNNWKYWKK